MSASRVAQYGAVATARLSAAYCSTPNYFNIVGEMRDQRKYTRSVLLGQGFVTMIVSWAREIQARR